MDLYINPTTNDLFLAEDGTARLTQTEEELTRQRLFITLSVFRGEWFANRNFSIPYLDRDGNGGGVSILGGKSLNILNFELQRAILNTEGVRELASYSSTYNKQSRTVDVVFSVRTRTGSLVSVEQVLI